jgi:hypothetical protein
LAARLSRASLNWARVWRDKSWRDVSWREAESSGVGFGCWDARYVVDVRMRAAMWHTKERGRLCVREKNEGGMRRLS